MKTLRFRTDLYRPEAIDLALQVFADFAQLDRRHEQGAQIVSIVAPEGADEDQIAGDFANYVLGATVDAGFERPEAP